MAVPAEQMLISSVLRNGDLKDAIEHGVGRNMFYIYPSEYAWIEDFWLKHQRTPSKGAFALQFPQFVRKQADDTIYFSSLVREEHKRRSVTASITDILDSLDNGDIDGALNLMYTNATKISKDMGLVNDGDVFRDHADIIKEFMKRKERYELYGTSGIPAGFETFDERTGGFAPGEMWVFAARPGQTKSWSLQKMACFAALAGYTVQFNALEQPRANVMARIVSLISNQIGGQLYSSLNLIRGKDYDQIEFMKFMNELENKIKGRLHVADGTQGRVTTSSIAAQIERNRADIVFVDHITLMGRRSNDWQGIGEVSSELVEISNRYGIPVVNAAQLNRTGTQSDAGLEAIAEADKIAQDASGVVFQRKMSERVIKYKVQKYRNGSGSFAWWTRFDPDQGVFREVDYDTAQELIEQDRAEETDSIEDDD